MGIFGKLLIAFLIVVAVPISIIGIVGHQLATNQINNDVEARLTAIANLQAQRIVDAELAGENELALITSRTQLRLSLAEFLKNGDPEALAKMNKILADAKVSVPAITRLDIANKDGQVVASSDPAAIGADVAAAPGFAAGLAGANADELIQEQDGTLSLQSAGPLVLEGESLGVLLSDSSPEALGEAFTKYTNLGETGETLVVARDQNGDLRRLIPTRFPAETLHETDLTRQAFAGTAGVFTGQDYRGEETLAAATVLPDQDWAVIVKQDVAEATGAVTSFQRTMALLTLLTLILGIVVAYVVARRLTKPLVAVAGTTAELSADLSARSAEADRGDEIGAVATGLNTLAAELQIQQKKLEDNRDQLAAANTQLDALVAERTQKLAGSEARMWSILSAAPDAIMTIGPKGKVDSANPSALALFGYSDGLVGENITDLLEVSLVEVIAMAVIRESSSVRSQSQVPGAPHETVAIRRDGTTFAADVAVGEVLVDTYTSTEFEGYTLIVRDITERKRAQNYLQFLANHDQHTGLVNRAEFHRFLTDVCHEGRAGLPFVVAYLDMDGFKQVNDTHGHSAGDELLRQVSGRMTDRIRQSDVAGRLGGDEFGIVFTHTNADAAANVLDRLRARLAEPYELAAGTVSVSVSIGAVAVTKELSGTAQHIADQCLAQADSAMYAGKRAGGDRVGLEMFHPDSADTAGTEPTDLSPDN